MKKITYVLTLFVLLLTSLHVNAQDILKSKDLSTINVDYLTDDDLAKISAQLKSNNTTIEQVEPMALSKGMSQTEYDKLKAKLNAYSPKSTDKSKIQESKRDNGRKQTTITNAKVKDSANAIVFGSELFDNPTLNFEPDLKLATPMNYTLGPGDELQVSVYGVQEYNASIPVSVEGKITIEYVGQISVSGMSVEAATQKIKAAISKVYSTVRSGQSQVSVSLSQIRTIKITVVGGKQPGNYSISSPGNRVTLE